MGTAKKIPSPKTCLVCQSDHRIDIENALMTGQSSATIAKFYTIDIDHITFHKEVCAAYVLTLDEFDALVARELFNSNIDASTGELLIDPATMLPIAPETEQTLQDANVQVTGLKKPGASLRRNLNIREADLLAASAQDLYLTQKNVSREINRQIDNISRTSEGIVDQKQFLRLPICQMYTGIASEIRQTIRTMADIDKMLNATETDNPNVGMFAVANAIERSMTGTQNQGGAQMMQPPLPPPDDLLDT